MNCMPPAYSRFRITEEKSRQTFEAIITRRPEEYNEGKKYLSNVLRADASHERILFSQDLAMMQRLFGRDWRKTLETAIDELNTARPAIDSTASHVFSEVYLHIEEIHERERHGWNDDE